MITRLLNLPDDESFFLFGARGVGKTTLIKNLPWFSNSLYINLLKQTEERRFSKNPDELLSIVQLLPQKITHIIIDEVQKLPVLLDLVHELIETTDKHFILTGSSARKLKRGASNLLAGRAYTNSLYPLSYQELGESFDLSTSLNFGMLPEIWNTDIALERSEYLRSYSKTYLKEEVWEEQLIKDLVPFRRFMEVVAQLNGEIINYANCARIVGCDTKTIKNYFSILEETLVGFQLDAYHTSIRKRIIQAPKFYLFDPGVKRAMDKTLSIELSPRNFAYGKAFEHFIITQIIFLSDYHRKDFTCCYLKTKDGAEIDLIVERPGLPTALIEIKSTTKVIKEDYNNLIKFQKDLKDSQGFCFSMDPYERCVDGINVLPWEKGLVELGLENI